jgi:hypothetical protein
MATSPNYGWAEPDNTDLVKNGALAIRTLGNAIDTTMATMTPKSTYTAKGSIAAATAASTPANLSVGNNGETLVADSSTSTGLRYQAVSAVKPNFAINGNYDFWQRGTSFTASGYTADRWYASVSGTTTVAQESTIVPDGSTYSLKWTTGAAASYAEMFNALEAQDVNALGGKTITVSLQVRAQASFASTFRLRIQTNTTANTQTSGTWTTVVTTDVTPSTSAFGVVTASYAVPVGTKGLRIALVPAAAQASGTGLYFGQVQLEVGSVATSYKYAGGTIQGELSAAQRYYYRANWDAKAAYPVFAQGGGYSTTSARLTMPLPVNMRVQPTAIDTSAVANMRVQSFNDGTSVAPSALTFDTNFTTTTTGFINATVASGLTANALYYLRGEGSTAYYIGWSAEL